MEGKTSVDQGVARPATPWRVLASRRRGERQAGQTKRECG